jgi:hypothetical protein
MAPTILVERMLDSDLAQLYGVTTGNLNLAIRRNGNRFPEDFMFQLTPDETNSLILQIARSKGRGGRRSPPFAFTERGVAMLSSVLGSERAVQVNIVIVRAFIKLREVLSNQKDLAQRVESLEEKYGKHDSELQAVFAAIGQLLNAPIPPKRRIGFAIGNS